MSTLDLNTRLLRGGVSHVIGACLALLLLTAAPARALPIQPPGLAPGESYHWMFITAGKVDSQSNDILVYDAFVNAEAALNPNLAGLTWHAIASTETIDAKVNAPVSGKVYLLDGTKFTDGFLTMWDGSSKGVSPEIDQFGVPRAQDPFPWVWTGTNHDGTAIGLGLGAQADNWAGRYTSTLANWLLEIHISSTVELPLYALSQPLKATAVPPVPEPSALALLSLALSGLIAGRQTRAGRQRQSGARV